MTIYLVDSYREFVEEMVQANKHVRGYKSRLAEAAGCHSSYLSQVLKGPVDLTLEQALNLASFWKLDPDETDFFLDLLLRDRAGNPKLREYYELRLKRARESRDFLASKTGGDKRLSLELAAIYYSSWHYSAVHTLATTKDYSSVERMASRLRMPPAQIKETLRILESMGILVRDEEGWSEGQEYVHLHRQSPMSATNHSNWRQRAIFNIQSRDPDSLHLLQLKAVKRSDLIKLKAILVEAVEKVRAVSDDSEPEEGVALVLDLFRI